MNQQTTPYPLRMPPALRSWIERRAQNNDRSMHREILRMLESERAKENASPVAAGEAS